MKWYAICDCDNCYVSCERIFRPDLEGKPVVVLSNNDGCVVARSAEAKRLGVKAGTPFYQLRQLFPNVRLEALSSNYELYGEITGRVMTIIRDMAAMLPLFNRRGVRHSRRFLRRATEGVGRRTAPARAAVGGHAAHYRHCAHKDAGKDGFPLREEIRWL